MADEGLWESALTGWYGPATPLMMRVRRYRPNRRGRIKLVRWLRVGILRIMAVCTAFVSLGIALTLPAQLLYWQGMLVAALGFAHAAAFWRCSLIRIVLRPGQIVRHGVFRHVVVDCREVNRLYRGGRRGSLTLETYRDGDVDFYGCDGSLWDALYDFSEICAEAMVFYAESTHSHPRPPGSRGVQRRFTWSTVADPLTLAALACTVAGLIARTQS